MTIEEISAVQHNTASVIGMNHEKIYGAGDPISKYWINPMRPVDRAGWAGHRGVSRSRWLTKKPIFYMQVRNVLPCLVASHKMI